MIHFPSPAGGRRVGDEGLDVAKILSVQNIGTLTLALSHKWERGYFQFVL